MKIKITLLGKLGIIVFFFIGNLFVVAQKAPGIEWQKALGGTQMDRAASVQSTSDGGYIMVGSTDSNDGDVTKNQGGYDFWVVKLNSNGDLEWQKTFGGSKDDMAYDIYQQEYEDYIIVGSTYSNDGDVTKNQGGSDFWVMKLSDRGDLMWQKTYGGSKDDVATNVYPILGSGFAVVGYTFSNDGDVTNNHGKSDFWVLKLNNFGDVLWEKTYGGSSYDEASFVRETTYGQALMVVGSTASTDGDITVNHGKEDFWILKLNGDNGNLIWQKTYGGSEDDQATGLVDMFQNGYIVTGSTRSRNGDVSYNHGMSDFWVLKLTDGGGVEWQKTYGGSQNEESSGILKLSGRGYVVTGAAQSNDGDVHGNHGNWDYWTVQLDDNGAIEWAGTYGGTGYDGSNYIVQNSSGAIVMAGVTFSNDGDVTSNHGNSDFWIVKLQSKANLEWNRPAFYSRPDFYGGSTSTCFIKPGDKDKNWNYGLESFRKGNGKAAEINSENNNVYPNPFQDVIYIKNDNQIENLSIRSLSGKVIKEVNRIYEKQYVLNTGDMAKGVYILTIITGDERYIRKIIKN